MFRKSLFALFSAAFIVSLVVTAPASLLGSWINRLSRGGVEFANSEGTLWHGSAVPVFHSAQGNLIPLPRIDWHVSLLPVIRGKVALYVKQGGMTQIRPVEIEAGIGGIELRHASLELPAELLELASPFLLAMHPEGRLQLSGEHLVFSADGLHGAASINWLTAGSAFSDLNPFGNYRIDLNASGRQVAIDLTTLDGPLLLEGRGEWSAGRGVAIDAHAKAGPEKQPALAELLHHLGPETAPGTYLIRIGSTI